MALALGPCKGRILSNTVKDINAKVAVSLSVEADGDATEVLIFITDKSMGIARRQLKLCGFNVDTQELEELEDSPKLLAGREIPLVVDYYKGKLQAQIDTNVKPERTAMQAAMAGLRSAKKSGFGEPAPEPGGDDGPPPPTDEHAPPQGDDIPF